MFHGIEELTIDSEGYIYWRKVQVEHYSGEAITKPNEARELNKRCRHIENLGLVPNTSNAIWRWHWVKDFTLNSPYQHLLLNHYSIEESPSGKCTILAKGKAYQEIDGIWQVIMIAEDDYYLYHNLVKEQYKTPVLDQPKCKTCPEGIQTTNQASYQALVKYLKNNKVPETLLY